MEASRCSARDPIRKEERVWGERGITLLGAWLACSHDSTKREHTAEHTAKRRTTSVHAADEEF